MPDDVRTEQHIYGNGAISKIHAEASDVKPIVKNRPNRDPMSTPHGRRMHRTVYQAKLGRKLDAMNQKVIDNNLRLSAHPTDMIRISVNRDERSHDLISRTVESVEVMPILLPKMEDIPLRHFIREDTDIMVPSLFATPDQEYFEVYAPVEMDLNEDDLLVRILNDSSPDIDESYVMVLQVKEVLGTFGYSSLVWKKLIVTFYDEKLPNQIVTAVKESIKKRERLNW